MPHEVRKIARWILLVLLLVACGKAPAPLAPVMTLGMTVSDFQTEFPGITTTSVIGDVWTGTVSSITVMDHANEHVLLHEQTSEVSLTIYPGRASTHIRPHARRPLREVIAYLEKDLPALLGKAGWKEYWSLADHWNSVYEHKCAPAPRKKLVRWELEMMDSIAPDQLEFGIICETLDLDSPAGLFINVQSGGSMLKSTPRR